jgi:hypothetical protein
VKKGNAIFAFNLKNTKGETESWYMDLKKKGEVFKGKPDKADGELVVLVLCLPINLPSSHATYRLIIAASVALSNRPC